MRLLGIDYGEKRIGIAVTDDKGMMAFPHSVVPNGKEAAVSIARIAEEKGVSTIVVGESRNYKGEENRIMKGARELAGSLERAGFEVAFEPELLSSHQAAHFQGKTDMIDASAASIILQSFIDRNKS